jgi:hypothetical protein
LTSERDESILKTISKTFMKSKYNKFRKWINKIYNPERNRIIVTIIVGLVIISAGFAAGNKYFPHILGASTKNEVRQIILPTPTVTVVDKKLIDRPISNSLSQQDSQESENTVDCTGPDGKHLQISQRECDDFNNTWNSNPIIACSISKECGGGTAQLTKSVCSNSTCCQIGDKWYLYSDKNQCGQDQKTYFINHITPTVTPTPEPTITPLPTIDIKLQNLNLYNQCVLNVKNLYHQKQMQCLSFYGRGTAGTACIQTVLQQQQQALINCSNQYPH